MKRLLEKILWKTYCKIANRPKAVLGSFGNEIFKNIIMDPCFPWEKYAKGNIPYFQQYGYNVPKIESEYYSLASGIKSDYYVPYTLWQYFIYPYLNRAEWRYAYSDKNMFDRILDINNLKNEIDVSTPETIVRNMNGLFYIQNRITDFKGAVDAIVNYPNDMIIKPSVETYGGHGVAIIDCSKINSNYISEILQQYKVNYIVQNKVVQHQNLESFNKSSVNTIRVTTYRDFKGHIKIIQTLQRFGAKGKVYDNASSGGGFCAISKDGTYDKTIHHFHTLKTSFLDKSTPHKVPYFEKIINICKYCHNQLPMFDIVAWDMTVSPDGHPYIIEYNFCPALELQMATGPLFSKEDLDEIMERIKFYKIKNEFKAVVSFPQKPGFIYRR